MEMVKKILVIDDDPDILEAVQLILHSAGFSTEATTDGEMGHGLAKDYRPDLIILDLLLAGVDGSALCRELKRDTQTGNIPVIMISAHPSASDSAESCGADRFLAKPFSGKDLLGEVGNLIDRPI